MTIQKCIDAEFLLPVLRAWKAECNDNKFGIAGSIEVTKNHLAKMILSPECAVFMLTDYDNPVGFIGVTIFESPISDDKMANEHLWYVVPEARGKASVGLLISAMRWAKSMGCSHFLCNASMLASDLHDQVCELYKSLGMEKFETTFICRLGGKV
jgi:hypothetical protein